MSADPLQVLLVAIAGGLVGLVGGAIGIALAWWLLAPSRNRRDRP